MVVRRVLALCLLGLAPLAAVGCMGGEEAAPAGGGVDAETRALPSYRLFSAWLAAFNRGDRERYQQFLDQSFPSRAALVTQEMGFRDLTGGFDLRKIEKASATELTGLVQERASDQFGRFDLHVEQGVIASLDLQAIPRPAEFAIPRTTAEQAIAGLEDMLSRSAVADRFSGAVLVSKDGRVLLRQASGLADRKRKIANTLQTRFRIGSMNKMFTAVAILQLVEAGKVDLQAPLGTYLPGYPNRDVAGKVTIHQLLTHTGGTGDIFGPDFDANRDELRTLADYVELYGNRGLEFEPGSRWEYSNYGFILLGRVIEEVTGQSYYDYVKEHVYDPAEMTRSGSAPEDQEVAGRSTGYMKEAGASEWAPNTDTLPYRGTSAGGGYSTVEDLARFAQALTSNTLLGERFTQMLITSKTSSHYAYGFEDWRGADGNGWVGHGGGAPGMNGDLRIYPTSGFVVAVLANVDPPAAQRVTEYLDARLPR
jgi:CubicO group peptidase (beta-lactamase class C family)